jgi:ubiquitin carboxyl-terminal hydrolase 1
LKKKRVKETGKLKKKVKLVLEEGRIGEGVKGVRMDEIVSRASTKQAPHQSTHFLCLVIY